MDVWDVFLGPNGAYVEELYERYLHDSGSVDAKTRAVFDAMVAAGGLPPLSLPEEQAVARTGGADAAKAAAAQSLAQAIRQCGHLTARIDPLGVQPPAHPGVTLAGHGLSEGDLAALPSSCVQPPAGGAHASAQSAIAALRGAYCDGPIGYEFCHLSEARERDWWCDAVESGRYRVAPADGGQQLLGRLTQVEGFERYLHQTFLGQKRFSIEGTDMLVPMLDTLIAGASDGGARHIVIGMAHRGRLNVLAHVLKKPYDAILSEFMHEGIEDQDFAFLKGHTGDVKYHLGFRRTIYSRDLVEVQLTLANNPSHLEFVNPVAQGLTRAAQDDRSSSGAPPQDVDAAFCVTVHGDASFPGEGVVTETLNLSQLRGYCVGGTVHIITNNQVGFTTEPSEDRSTHYASDPAKGYDIPILHVNADDPQACLTATAMAFAYRSAFHKDVLIDLYGYRRWGHNEGDEPLFTQPRLYERISAHPTVRALYAARLVQAGVLSEQQAQAEMDAVLAQMQAAHAEASPHRDDAREPEADPDTETGVAEARLRAINGALLARPEGFMPNTKLERLLQRRSTLMDKEGGIDWSHAEALAFGAMLQEGVPVRLSGQDAQRGTFSQRHAALVDSRTGERYLPLQHLGDAEASFVVINSALSETAAMGFEYGYSLGAPGALVLWEAQFGDFANAGQVIVDQFLAAARGKWDEHSALVLLLPHGFEGQGPEHSSARLERYLQLAADDNLRVANCTTSAQYFHLLRRQAALLGSKPRPLIVMTPKSLLRHSLAASSLADLTTGGFRPVLDDAAAAEPKDVTRLVLCSGKVAVEYLTAQGERGGGGRSALVRLEQIYPFPYEELRQVMAKYPSAQEMVWLQEEPRNMGAWSFVAPRLVALRPELTLSYVGWPEQAAPAVGSPDVHSAGIRRIVDEALNDRPVQEVRVQGGGKHGN